MGVRIKGQAFIGFMAKLRQMHGEKAHEEVLAQLDRDLAAGLRTGALVSMGWYSMEWYSSLHAAAREVCGNRVSREVGREAARDDVNTIYRFILKFLSPETLLGQAGKVFSQFCEGGKCTVESTRKGSARILYSDCPGACRGMWENVLGSTELMVELCGGRDVIGKALTGGGDGDRMMLAQITWTGG
jgi:hypothetical protein